MVDLITEMEHCFNQKHEGVVLVSKKVDSRNICLACAYLMLKYNWHMDQAIDLVISRFESA